MVENFERRAAEVQTGEAAGAASADDDEAGSLADSGFGERGDGFVFDDDRAGGDVGVA